MNPDNKEQAISHFLWQFMIWVEMKKEDCTGHLFLGLKQKNTTR